MPARPTAPPARRRAPPPTSTPSALPSSSSTPSPPGGEGPDGPDPAAFTAYGEQITAPAAVVAATAAADAGDAARTLEHVAHDLAQGDASAFSDPATFAALGTVEQAVADACGFTNVAIDGADYNVEGVPDTLPAGVTNFLLANVSEHGEEHVAIVLRSPDGDPVTPRSSWPTRGPRSPR